MGGRIRQPPKIPEEKARDEALAREILQQVEGMRGVKVTLVDFDRFGYNLEVTGDEAFRFLMEALQQAPHLVSSSRVRVWKTYTSRELEASPLLLWRVTNQAIEDDYYTLYFKEGQAKGIAPYTRHCATCGAPLQQVRDMWVDATNMGERDLSLTYSFEIILSERLARLFQEAGLTGFRLHPVQHCWRPYPGESVLYQLVVTHTLPAMASPPTEFEEVKHCPECGTTTRYLKHTHYWGKIRYYEDTDVYYTREALKGAEDFNRTAELFGEPRIAKPWILISQRVYRLLKEHKVKGWAAVPVYLVD